jgi:hypothetical protein
MKWTSRGPIWDTTLESTWRDWKIKKTAVTVVSVPIKIDVLLNEPTWLNTMLCHDADHHNMNIHHCGNLKSYNTQRMSTTLSRRGNKREKTQYNKTHLRCPQLSCVPA